MRFKLIPDQATEVNFLIEGSCFAADDALLFCGQERGKFLPAFFFRNSEHNIFVNQVSTHIREFQGINHRFRMGKVSLMKAVCVGWWYLAGNLTIKLTQNTNPHHFPDLPTIQNCVSRSFSRFCFRLLCPLRNQRAKKQNRHKIRSLPKHKTEMVEEKRGQ